MKLLVAGVLHQTTRRARVAEYADSYFEFNSDWEGRGHEPIMTHWESCGRFPDADSASGLALARNRMTGYVNSIDGTAAYTNDAASQLTGADYTYQPPLADETYVYDANGNRTNNGYSVGPNNRLTSDGTHTYTYSGIGGHDTSFGKMGRPPSSGIMPLVGESRRPTRTARRPILPSTQRAIWPA